MSSLTVEEVVNAFKTLGCRPVQGKFRGEDDDGRTCYCVLSALYVSRGGEPDNLGAGLSSIVTEVSQKLGVSREFARGILYGWDQMSLNSDYQPRGVLDGYAFGQKALEEVSEHVESVLRDEYDLEL